VADHPDVQSLYHLVDALVPLMEANKLVHLVLVGFDEHLRTQLNVRALNAGLENRFHFSDRPPHVAQRLFAFDIYATTPEGRVPGSTFVEASASGIPVVATAVGCIPEVIENGVSGYVVKPADRLILRSVLGKLIADSALRKCLANAARQNFQSLGRFAPARMAEELEGAYLEWLHTQEKEVGACRWYRV